MTKSKIPSEPYKNEYNLGAYNTRDVFGLPPVLGRWSPELLAVQQEHNRILQPGFMHRDAATVLKDAKTAGVDWLTSITCPSASAAIMLHIAKEMVVKYQVGDEELNLKAQEAHQLLARPQTIEAINAHVEREYQRKIGENEINLEEKARAMLRENLAIEDAQILPEQLAAAKNLVEDKERRKIIDETVSKLVTDHLNANQQALGLIEKTLHQVGTTNDFAFFGAAGSGKSTISQQYLSDGPDNSPNPKINRRDCVTLATDNYRAFTMPGTGAHENTNTKDVYTRSQDFAYMVKEYVANDLVNLSRQGQRPNLICDCVRLEWPMGDMLRQTANGPGTLVSKVAAYRGSPGFVGIAERADSRAKDENAAPADKGRFVHTTDLLKGHADASAFLLRNLPPNTQTEILDTDVNKDAGEKPRPIAMIDSTTRRVEISDLRVMSEFMNKQSINTKAQHPVELILKAGTPESPSPLQTSPSNKAKAILALVGDYTVTLKDSEGTPYAEFLLGEDRQVKLNVLNTRVYTMQLIHFASPEAQVLAELTKLTSGPTIEAGTGKSRETPEGEAAHLARRMQIQVEAVERVMAKKLKTAEADAVESVAKAVKMREAEEANRMVQESSPEAIEALEKQNLATRILSAAIASPKIITGNYSAIMNCLNDVLTNTVTIAPEGNNRNKSPIFFIAEPMWLDSVDPSYDQELWGQGIDAFPPAVQKFAQEQLKPAPVRGEKLTWGQVRELRAKMLERLEKAPGFTVIKGEIAEVEQVDHPVEREHHDLKIHFKTRQPQGSPTTVSIPFTGRPLVLDLSQRARPAGSPALEGDPTILYRQSREQNALTSDVPIFIAGSGAQAAWVMDKMDTNRTYTVIYRGTLDFRIANAVLGRQKYGPDTALVSVDPAKNGDAELMAKLQDMKDGAIQRVRYQKDDGQMVDVNLNLYHSLDKNKRIFPADDLLNKDPEEAQAFLMGLGVKESDVEQVMRSAANQMRKLEDQHLNMDQIAIKLNTNPAQIDLGFAVNTTGFQALNDLDPRTKFWGDAAQVITGEKLTADIKVVTTASLLPNSGLPRMLAMKAKLQEMRGEAPSYDVRALAFTESGFTKMCSDCGFSQGFKQALAGQIKQMETPSLAGDDPVEWIAEKYGEWLEQHPGELSIVEEPQTEPPPTREALIQKAKGVAIEKTKDILQENVNKHVKAEESPGMRI